jgi:hypothetical protein
MERYAYRSTSLAHLLAEIRQRELLAEAERLRQPRPTTRRRTLLGLPIPGRRPRA